MLRSTMASVLAGALLWAASASAAPPSTEAWNSRELHGFIDGLLEAQRKAHHFAGAVVVVVRDGHIALEKGYGYADFAERQLVDPRRTLFRIASNSKMFVWTAVMQLVEEGKLDLHTDVNQYLRGFQIPPTFPAPITLEHLMTHTPGFEDRVVGLFAKTPDKLRPLPELLKSDMPRRVSPPGTVTAYSNYGTALAALIVEQISGRPFESYLKDRILEPLGMMQATIRQPVPDDLVADLSRGYRWTEGRLTEQSFEYVPWAPAGAMSVSGADMGRFMIAHLNDGALGEARILRPETARVMRTRLASFSPAPNGVLHGFVDMDWNGEKVYGHGGATVWFHSLTAMLPERRLGVFVAYNTNTGRAVVRDTLVAFLDHYFPVPLAKEPAVLKDAGANLERFAGTYAPARVSQTDLTKVIKLALATSITVQPDGYLRTTAVGETARWRAIEPLVFAEVDGKRRLVFRENERGEVMDVCASPACIVVLQKQPWWGGRGFQLASLGASLAILALALVGFPVAAVLQRKQSRPAGSKLARLTAWLASLAFLAGLAIFASKVQDPDEVAFGVSRSLQAALGLWVTASVLSAGLTAFTLAAWRRRWWRTAGRICVTLVCVAAIGLVAWLHHWNLLGWRY